MVLGLRQNWEFLFLLRQHQWPNCCHGNDIKGVIVFLLWCTFMVPSFKNTALTFPEISFIQYFIIIKVKSLLYKARTKLKNVKTSDVFPSYAFASREDQRIFINENLTNYRRELFWRANKMKKDNMITSTWTMDGKIFVKTSPSGTPVRILLWRGLKWSLNGLLNKRRDYGLDCWAKELLK